MSDTREPLEIVFVTVNEFYYIPRFLSEVVDADGLVVKGIVTLPPSLGTEHMIPFVYKLYDRFGPKVFLQHGLFYAGCRLMDLFNRLNGRKPAYSPQALAQEHGIEYRHVRDVNSPEMTEYFERKAPDVIASVAATQRFEPHIISLPAKGTINVHSSLLPEYRGVSPSFWALLNDEDYTGISVHFMSDELDTGDVLKQERLRIRPDDTLHSLNKRVAERGSDVLLDALRAIQTNDVQTDSIDPDEGSYYSLPEREDVKEFLRQGNEFY